MAGSPEVTVLDAALVGPALHERQRRRISKPSEDFGKLLAQLADDALRPLELAIAFCPRRSLAGGSSRSTSAVSSLSAALMALAHLMSAWV